MNEQNKRLAMFMVERLSQGNPGAISVLAKVLSLYPEQAPFICSALADNNVLGPKIWERYKDECGEDMARFIAATVGNA